MNDCNKSLEVLYTNWYRWKFRSLCERITHEIGYISRGVKKAYLYKLPLSYDNFPSLWYILWYIICSRDVNEIRVKKTEKTPYNLRYIICSRDANEIRIKKTEKTYLYHPIQRPIHSSLPMGSAMRPMCTPFTWLEGVQRRMHQPIRNSTDGPMFLIFGWRCMVPCA